MEKIICFLYTETTNTIFNSDPIILDETIDLNFTNDINKKNLYYFVRLLTFNYEIGYYKNNKFIQLKKNKKIVKPYCMHVNDNLFEYYKINQDDLLNNAYYIETIINEFKEDIKTYKIDIIIGHNINFHLKTLLSESIRYNILLDLSKYLIIDVMNFYHTYNHTKLIELFIKINKKNIESTKITKLDMIKKIFIKLYTQYKDSIN